MLTEIKTLILIGEHTNLVNLIGAHTKSTSPCIIMEYCAHGDLLNFLRGRRNEFRQDWFKKEKDMAVELTLIDLAKIASQAARGMEFLASKRVSLFVDQKTSVSVSGNLICFNFDSRTMSRKKSLSSTNAVTNSHFFWKHNYETFNSISHRTSQ